MRDDGVNFLPVRVLSNLMRVYFLPVRVIIADLMKVCFHSLRVLADYDEGATILRALFFEPVTLSVYHDLNIAGKFRSIHFTCCPNPCNHACMHEFSLL